MNKLLIASFLSLALPIATYGQATQPTTQPTTKPSTRPSQAAVVQPGSTVLLNVAYVPEAKDLQKLDLYAPAAGDHAPVVVFIHGGEWARGDKSNVSSKPKFFNEKGIIFISANYRLSTTDKHPAQVNDIAAALKWTRDNIDKFGGDPKKIVLMGHSAGCHMVTLVGLDAQYLAGVGMKPSDLAAVVSWSGGAFDLVDKVKQGGMYEGFIRQNFGQEDPEAWKKASPMEHIADDKPQVKFLFASAEQGNPASAVATHKMVELITKAGGSAAEITLKDRDHFNANHQVGAADDQTGYQFLQFLQDAMKE